MRKRFIFISLLALCCASAWALTEAELDSITHLFTLKEVDVVAQRHIPEVLPSQSLEGEHLQSLSAHSVADALRYFSGVQIKDYGGVGGIKTVDMRSMGSHHLGVFYDGIEIGNAQNGTVDLGKFSLENIESISLYNGQKTESLQSAKDFGSAGTIYIRTRRPVFNPGKNYNVSIAMKAGCFGLANPSLLYEQKLTESLHLSLNAEYTYATGRYPFTIKKYSPNGTLAWDTTGYRQNGDINAFRAEAGLFGYLPQGKWHIKGYYYQSEKGIPKAIIRNVWTSSQRQWDRNAFVQGAFQYTVAKRWDLQISAKYANDKLRYLNPDTKSSAYVDNTYLQQEVYLSWANRVELFNWWDLTISGDYIYNTLTANLYHFANPIRHTGLVAAATSFHYKWIQAQASVLGNFIKDTPNPLDKGAKAKVTPAVFLSYQPYLPEQLFIRAFYKQIFRMPTFNDLYYSEVGYSALDPEETRQYDVSLEYSKELTINNEKLRIIDLNCKIDGYYNQVKNKIVAIPKGNTQYRWQMMNLGYVEIRGVDVNASVTCHLSPVIFSLSGTYTYQKAQDFTDPNNPLTYGGQIAYIPWHNASALANLTWRGLCFNYCFSYVGTRYTSSANILVNQVPAWLTHDVSLGYKWRIKNEKLKMNNSLNTTLEINNLANYQYEIVKNYPMPGLNGKLIIQYQF